MRNKLLYTVIKLFFMLWEAIYLWVLILIAIIARFHPKRCDVGIGPEPLINNIYHKKALELYGYSAETFVTQTYHITKNFDRCFIYNSKIMNLIFTRVLFIDLLYVLFNFKIIYLYFNGGPLGKAKLIWRLEPFIYKLAKLRCVVMPYGSDHQLMDRTKNLYFKHCMSLDYPQHKLRYSRLEKQLLLWSSFSDHVISGCDWVDYMHHWDTLMLGHFCIDTETHSDTGKDLKSKTQNVTKVLHAPNHRHQKGTNSIINAIAKLKAEGYEIELELVEKVSHEVLMQKVRECDIVVDQLVIGWYAMFALEAMAINKPVICYLRDDLKNLYVKADLLSLDDLPIIEADTLSIYNVLKNILLNDDYLEKAQLGSAFVQKYHSLRAVGKYFHDINSSLSM